MTDLSRPLLVLYVIWHPDYADGGAIAEVLREHFRRKLYENIAGGMGLSVIYRYAAAPGSAAPLPIDLNEAEENNVQIYNLADLVKENRKKIDEAEVAEDEIEEDELF